MKIIAFIYFLIFSLPIYSVNFSDLLIQKNLKIKKYKNYEIEKILDKASKILKIKIILLKIDKNQKIKLKFEEDFISVYDIFYTIENNGGWIQLIFQEQITFIIYWPPQRHYYDYILGKTLKNIKVEDSNLNFNDVLSKVIDKNTAGYQDINEVFEILSNYHKIIFTKLPISYFEYLEKEVSLLKIINAIYSNPFLKLFLHFSEEGKIIFHIISFKPI